MFNKCLGMPIEGYEAKILGLLRKIKARKETKG